MTAEKKEEAAERGRAGTRDGRRGKQPADPHVANALRSAYEETVQEDVPSEFLELLGKLT